MELEQGKKIILFDGVCNLCNGAVTFIIKRDKRDRFRYAALQSEVGKKLTDSYKVDTEEVDSIILVEGDLHEVISGASHCTALVAIRCCMD